MISDTLAAAKALARQDARRARAAAQAAHPSAPLALASRLLPLCADWRGAVVAGYAAVRSELPVWPVLEMLAERGAQLALPCIVGAGQALIFRQWQPAQALETGPLGIDQPGGDAPILTPTHVLVPLLAFDVVGHRLGYGGGYYDRTLAQLRADGVVMAIGVAYDEQRMANVPRAALDQQLDAVVTPSRLYRF